MPRGSPSSPSRSEKTKKRPSSPTPSPSPSQQKMVNIRRKGDAEIDDPKKCQVTFFKRSEGLIKKTRALSSLTSAGVAIIIFSRKGELRFFGNPSIEGVISRFLRCKGYVMLPMSPKEGVDCCATKEECDSLIMKYEEALDLLRKRSKDLENNPANNAGASRESGVGAGHDRSNGVDRDISLTSPADSAATNGESSSMDLQDLYAGLDDIITLLDHDGFRTWWSAV